jgi:alpha-ketoglutarate-dependent taurine dioxygenase
LTGWSIPDERRKTVASYRRIEVKPIAGALGAEIANVDLGTLDDETFREIEAAWLEHLVVFFRNQTLTPEQQIAFAKRFGEIHYHPFMECRGPQETEPERRDRFYERRPLHRQREDGSQGSRPRRPADGIRASACADPS